ncbi:MAG: BamA/TamA family outer membrane protein [Acidobacteriota bacterium]
MIAAVLFTALLFPQAAPPPEVLADVQVRGNVATPDAEIRRLAGLEIGMRVEADVTAQAAERLRGTGRFDRVEVMKRYASLTDPTQIVLVVLVDEGAVSIQRTGDPANPTRVVRRRWPNLLFFPIFSAESGYGVTYGARLTHPEPAGRDSRISFPMTWGGRKRIAAEFEKRVPDGWVTRVEAGGSVSRQVNPLFDADDDRLALWFRPERQMTRSVRVRALTGWQRTSFQAGSDRFTSLGAEVIVDTRLDPFLARNAFFVQAARSRLAFDRRPAVTTTALEAHGYLGLPGQTILVASAKKDGADGPLPSSLKPLLGGPGSVRGFRTGAAAGDSLVAGALELRVPLTSPLNFAKVGVSAFVDAGAAYDSGERFADQPVQRGIGGSVWFAAAFFRFNIAVAHGIGATTRVHVGGNLTF